MRNRPEFRRLLATGNTIPVPNGVGDKNSFRRLGIASRRNRKETCLHAKRRENAKYALIDGISSGRFWLNPFLNLCPYIQNVFTYASSRNQHFPLKYEIFLRIYGHENRYKFPQIVRAEDCRAPSICLIKNQRIRIRTSQIFRTYRYWNRDIYGYREW